MLRAAGVRGDGGVVRGVPHAGGVNAADAHPLLRLPEVPHLLEAGSEAAAGSDPTDSAKLGWWLASAAAAESADCRASPSARRAVRSGSWSPWCAGGGPWPRWAAARGGRWRARGRA